MSVLANPKEDGVNWPMILNVPGEGFGDDFLQKYSNHSLLTDEDDNLFLLDEALESIGRMCNSMGSGGGGPPPTGEDQPHIPSNLEVDPNSWFSNEYTYSPVWKPPMKLESNPEATSFGKAVTKMGSVVVSSCYDSSNKAVEMEVEFIDVQKEDGSELPWMALGYRESAECRMNPLGGGDAELIFLTSEKVGDEEIEPYYTTLPSAARSFSEDAFTSIRDNLVPLDEKQGYTDVSVHLPGQVSALARSGHTGSGGSLVLQFKQNMNELPDSLHLMYTIGSSPEIGYHLSRECIDIIDFPACPDVSSASTESVETQSASNNEESSGTSLIHSLNVGVAALTSTLLFLFFE